VAAAALGLAWDAPDPVPSPAGAAPDDGDEPPALRIHQGTLRSGDHLHSEGSLLVLGDVNPGARVEAGGHVLVWGTLRGVAHAGCGGDTSARITALQLRPLQLRIAGAVARGPQERPAPGLAEQARLVDGVIRIDPAEPVCHPLDRRMRERTSSRP
jgi:septum site-determining protein MinC